MSRRFRSICASKLLIKSSLGTVQQASILAFLQAVISCGPRQTTDYLNSCRDRYCSVAFCSVTCQVSQQSGSDSVSYCFLNSEACASVYTSVSTVKSLGSLKASCWHRIPWESCKCTDWPELLLLSQKKNSCYSETENICLRNLIFLCHKVFSHSDILFMQYAGKSSETKMEIALTLAGH